MKRYTTAMGNVSSSAAGAQRVADIVAALAPPPNPGTAITPVVPKHEEHSVAGTAVKMVPGLAGGAIGWMMFRRTHPVLGFLGGHAVGSAAYSLYKGGTERKRALCQLGVEAAGIAGALKWKSHPVAGWVAGIAAGTVVSSFIPGSPACDELAELKSWLKKKMGR